MKASFLILSFAVVLMAGCHSVEVVDTSGLDDHKVAHVCISNYGWRLFGCVPLVCGNSREDASCPFAFFRDDLAPDLVHAKLAAVASARGTTPSDVFLLDDGEVLFDAYYTVLPWIICYKEINLSANLVRKEAGR